MALYEMEDAKERVILVGVQENDAEPEKESLDELAELARTAGAEVAGRLIQKREAMHPGDVYRERKDPGAEGTFVGDRRYGNHL